MVSDYALTERVIERVAVSVCELEVGEGRAVVVDIVSDHRRSDVVLLQAVNTDGGQPRGRHALGLLRRRCQVPVVASAERAFDGGEVVRLRGVGRRDRAAGCRLVARRSGGRLDTARGRGRCAVVVVIATGE
jgi:hypothetical protein